MKQFIYDFIEGREPEIWVALKSDDRIKDIYLLAHMVEWRMLMERFWNHSQIKMVIWNLAYNQKMAEK